MIFDDPQLQPDIVILEYGYNDVVAVPPKWRWIKRRKAIKHHHERRSRLLAAILREATREK